MPLEAVCILRVCPLTARDTEIHRDSCCAGRGHACARLLLLGDDVVQAVVEELQALLQQRRDAQLPGACLGLAALSAGGGEAALSEQLSGPDLSLFRLQSMVQAVVWIDLLTALLLPGTVAVAQSGPLHWLLGLSFWALRLLAGGVVLGGVRGLAATATARRRLAGLSVLLGLLAPLLFLVGHRAG